MKQAIVFGMLCALCMLSLPVMAQDQSDSEKPHIRGKEDLAHLTYATGMKPSDVYQSDAAITHLAQEVHTDLEPLLRDAVIEDQKTEMWMHTILASIAMIDGAYERAAEHYRQAQALEEDPGDRALTGLYTLSFADAKQAIRSGDEDDWDAAFAAALRKRLDPLSWDLVKEGIMQRKMNLEVMTKSFTVGVIRSQMDPAFEAAGTMSLETADWLLYLRAMDAISIPNRNVLLRVLGDYIDAHHMEKTDIWAVRAVDLPASDAKNPVVIGMWGTGVDPDVFGDRMFVNPQESPNGRDDDGNGFVDDIHGIAYGVWGENPGTEMLLPMTEEQRKRVPSMLQEIKGLLDLRASVASPEADAFRTRITSLGAEEVAPYMNQLGLSAAYVMGTFIAGIAVDGNPAARILVVRETMPEMMRPEPLTAEYARRWVEKMQRSVAYFKQMKTRVVNIDWSMSEGELENQYTVSGIGKDTKARKEMAAEVYGILKDGLNRAFASAPEILFVTAPYYCDEETGDAAGIPAIVTLPNVFVVSTVDQAGDETAQTCHGKAVHAHANGVEAESVVPGGEKITFSGMSICTPHVTNLAAKLFALDPSLTPTEVADLIVRGADRSEDGQRVLINPKRSVALLQEK